MGRTIAGSKPRQEPDKTTQALFAGRRNWAGEVKRPHIK